MAFFNITTRQSKNGFTIVELLVVIVVIGILAAITIVSYNGLQNRATLSSLQITLSSASKKLEFSRINSVTDVYPANLADADVVNPKLDYSVNGTNKGYCLVATDRSISSYVTNASSQSTNGSCVSAAGLLAWWPLDGTTEDISGNKNDGVGDTITSTSGQNGQANNAYSFNGTSSQIVCGTSATIRPTTSVSLSVWVYLNSQSSNLSGFINVGGGGYWLHANSAGISSIYTSSTVLGGPTLNIGQWYHVVGTFISGQRQLYINGALAASDVASGVTSLTGYYTEPCRLGSIKNISGRFLNGKLDDARIYDRVLSAAEIQALFSNGAQ